MRVRVRWGRWEGREGELVGEHRNPGRAGGQQSQTYPVVALEARGRAVARTVRVLAVEPVPEPETETGDGDSRTA